MESFETYKKYVLDFVRPVTKSIIGTIIVTVIGGGILGWFLGNWGVILSVGWGLFMNYLYQNTKE